MDAPLSATLQFSTPLTNKISSWPAQNAEISKKLKKTHKALPAFGWDTEPVVGNEEIIEEAFVDVFCDLIYGGGWMDLERGEMLDRDCNWALVSVLSVFAGWALTQQRRSSTSRCPRRAPPRRAAPTHAQRRRSCSSRSLFRLSTVSNWR